MDFERLNEQDISDIKQGDIIVTNGGSRMIARDKGEYALITLEGIITTSWYENVNDLIESVFIKEIIKNNKVKLVEL